ncbi:MAG: AAA family ATPase [Lachnospiraceae bacterium]|nr:AAA family ATPase [Lachnospiraceae bacterium]
MHGNVLVNLGEQRFDQLIGLDKFYIDKTDFIREWWENGATATLITRPRRFGKTLNMSMIECFFSNNYAGRWDLFEGLSIWREEKYRELQGTYPVIFLSFAGVKTGKIEEMKSIVKQLITEIYDQYRDIMKSDQFGDKDRMAFQSVNKEMDDATAYMAIRSLCNYLQKYYDKKVIILLDEYDTPMHEAWIAGTWDHAAAFFRNFFNNTFKSNPQLHKGMITGITRISKESIFSDLNNLDVVTITSDKYAAAFGFTEEEVFQALDEAGLGKEKQGVKEWYDGFTFGSHTDIYNPWSIASFIDGKGKYKAYWTNTSGNGLINSLIRRGDADVKQTMEELLQGRSFKAEIDEQIVFNQLEDDSNAIWSLLMATGYLKVLKTEPEECENGFMAEDDIWYTLALTNYEVQQMFRKMVKGWFTGSVRIPYNHFIKALLTDDVDSMNEFMNRIALHSFSSFDIAQGVADDDAPERFYHGFVLGLMVDLSDRYVITSNRESGFGRYDIMMKPVDRECDCAYIIEFKVYKSYKEKTLEDTLANAHAQIEEKQYEAELISEGYVSERIRKYGFVFQGKKCLIG